MPIQKKFGHPHTNRLCYLQGQLHGRIKFTFFDGKNSLAGYPHLIGQFLLSFFIMLEPESPQPVLQFNQGRLQDSRMRDRSQRI